MPSKSFNKFQKRLVLAAYFRECFGVRDPEDPKAIRQYHETLRTTKEGFAPSGVSYLVQALQTRKRVSVSDADLIRYDEHIRAHTDAINARRTEPITWKYFQHLAGLMTEHYLHRLKTDAEAFAADINAFAARRNEHRTYIKYPEVSAGDLNKLAYWMATGSGKTLLMHLNYYQYRHYFGAALDHILLVTPNEGLTRQHMRELRQSGIDSVYYLDLLEGSLDVAPEGVKVIEISKLVEDKTDEGIRVEVDAFEGRNLVFVDEGHKGARSAAGTWRSLRAGLAADGFTFEYSATFGQAVGGSTPAAVEEEYGKAILFDYSYQRFYEDGYGKDYRILNLETSADEVLAGSDDLTDRYLLANLLTFYEQQLVFGQDERRMREAYHLRKPLLMFIGHSVTGGRSVSDLGTNDKRSVTDIQRLVAFLHRVLTDSEWAEGAIRELLTGDSPLQIDGNDLFADAFGALRAQLESGWTVQALLGDLRERLFHASGATGLRLVNLTSAQGEIGLRAGDADAFFGVIDVGNDRGFLQLTEQDLPDITIAESAFEGSLFKRINRRGSNVNVLLGAKKFIEGWSSWRVSTMGLMNIGRGEGPQIIQLFGRGVRLLGKNRSLKRSTALPEAGPHPRRLPLLETLNIFGVRAKYMAQFRNYLEDEGIDTEEREIIRFKTRTDNRFVGKGLQVIRPRTTVTYESQDEVRLSIDDDIVPELDLTPQMEALVSADAVHETPATYDMGENRYVDPGLLPLLDWKRIYRTCWRYREKEGYTNLTFDVTPLRELIEAQHYVLRCPAEMIECNRFEDRRDIESIVLRILRTYITAFHSSRKQQWERSTMQYETLTKQDGNLVAVIEARVRRSATTFIEKLLDRLEHIDTDGEVLFVGDDALYETESGTPPRVYFERHLYLPLVTQEDDVVKYSPPGLNTGERTFIEHLRSFLRTPNGGDFMKGKELYVLRNQSRGQGVGFQMQEGGRFFPDFILWLVDDSKQHMIFVDPKGLNVGMGGIDADAKVTFCKSIGAYQQELNERSGRDDIRLHAFIFSTTDFQTIQQKQTIDTREEFADRHIYFLEDGPTAVHRMLARTHRADDAAA